MSDELTRLFAAKEARRRILAAQSFPEKIRILVRLQALAAPILRARGRQVRVWAPESSTQSPLQPSLGNQVDTE